MQGHLSHCRPSSLGDECLFIGFLSMLYTLSSHLRVRSPLHAPVAPEVLDVAGLLELAFPAPDERLGAAEVASQHDLLHLAVLAATHSDPLDPKPPDPRSVSDSSSTSTHSTVSTGITSSWQTLSPRSTVM